VKRGGSGGRRSRQTEQLCRKKKGGKVVLSYSSIVERFGGGSLVEEKGGIRRRRGKKKNPSPPSQMRKHGCNLTGLRGKKREKKGKGEYGSRTGRCYTIIRGGEEAGGKKRRSQICIPILRRHVLSAIRQMKGGGGSNAAAALVPTDHQRGEKKGREEERPSNLPAQERYTWRWPAKGEGEESVLYAGPWKRHWKKRKGGEGRGAFSSKAGAAIRQARKANEAQDDRPPPEWQLKGGEKKFSPFSCFKNHREGPKKRDESSRQGSGRPPLQEGRNEVLFSFSFRNAKTYEAGRENHHRRRGKKEGETPLLLNYDGKARRGSDRHKKKRALPRLGGRGAKEKNDSLLCILTKRRRARKTRRVVCVFERRGGGRGMTLDLYEEKLHLMRQ